MLAPEGSGTDTGNGRRLGAVPGTPITRYRTKASQVSFRQRGATLPLHFLYFRGALGKPGRILCQKVSDQRLKVTIAVQRGRSMFPIGREGVRGRSEERR